MTSAAAAPGRDRTRVAILGGGCGGLSAAWALTATPELCGRFEVTVHQRGWRLGGKGASARVPGDAIGGERSWQRIEEHGLHLWFGFYAHAFGMLKQAYEESGLARGEEWWRTPFQKCSSVSLYDRRDDGSWVRQPVTLPALGGDGCGPPTEPRRTSLPSALAHMTRLLAVGLRAELLSAEARRRAARSGRFHPADAAAAVLEDLATELEAVLAGAGAPALRGVGGGGGAAHEILRRAASRRAGAAIERLVACLLGHIEDLHPELERPEFPDRLRLWRGVLEMVAATLTGIVSDGLLWRGLSAIDGEDLRAWLERHGASAETLERTPVLRGLYDLTFAYRSGDKSRPSLAAGKGLQSLLMMVDYDGAFMWRMQAGMGDVVFSPLYLALRERGVKFRFFSRVDAVRLAHGCPAVDSIELTREAIVLAGADAYDPIKAIGDWSCWPVEPYRSQLANASRPAPETLHRGADFDDVVLAIPVGALRSICGDLAAASPDFKRMLDGAETVRTKAFQVWLTKPVQELSGVQPANGGQQLDPPATAYAEPFDTYCDMSHLLGAEGYGKDGPRGIAYFCAVLPDAVPEEQSVPTIRADARRHLEEHARSFWPHAFDGDEFDWSILWDPLNRSGPERLDAQFFRANVDGSDRYVTTPAGSVDSRLCPDQSGFVNLVLAGDWTHNEIDGGCVEAAVISGQRAGRALIAADDMRREGNAAPTPPLGTRDQKPAAGRGGPIRHLPPYVEFGALATAPGPLECERARIYCFFLSADRARVQHLCDRVLKTPTGGALRYHVPAAAPVILTFGVLDGLRSTHPLHAAHGSALESEAAIWIPTVAQRWDADAYVSTHLAIFMPYIWVDDPVALASGREVYGFPKTQGWIDALGDPLVEAGQGVARDLAKELRLEVYGTPAYSPTAVLGRHRLLTVRRAKEHVSGAPAEGFRLAELLHHFMMELEPDRHRAALAVRRPAEVIRRRIGATLTMAGGVHELLSEQVVRHVFLKQVRDAGDGEKAALQQIVEARSSVTLNSLHWRRLHGVYELEVTPLESHPLEGELGLDPAQTTRLAFIAEFGFRMEPGEVIWPRG